MKIFGMEIKRAKSKPNRADLRILDQLFYGGKATVDDPRDDDYVDKGYEGNPTVYSIVNTIATNASQVPWYVYKKKADGTKEKIDMTLVQDLLDRPNHLETWSKVIQKAISYKLVTGNTFLWGVNPDAESLNAGKPQAFWVLPSQDMQIWQKGAFQGISHYAVDFAKESKPIAADEMLHISTTNLDYDETGSFLYGQSPLRAAYTNLITANEAIITGKSYIDNQGPAGLLSAKHGPDTPSFDKEQARELKKQFRRDYQGSTNANNVNITPMQFDYINMGASAADLKLIEQYNISKIDICNVFGFPPVLLSIGSATYENQREAKLSMWEDIVIPLLKELRDGINSQFISKFGKDICIDFDLSDIMVLQERLQKQASALTALQHHLTINEIRGVLGKKPLAGGDVPLPLQGVTGNEGTKEAAKKPKQDGT